MNKPEKLTVKEVGCREDYNLIYTCMGPSKACQKKSQKYLSCSLSLYLSGNYSSKLSKKKKQMKQIKFCFLPNMKQRKIKEEKKIREPKHINNDENNRGDENS